MKYLAALLLLLPLASFSQEQDLIDENPSEVLDVELENFEDLESEFGDRDSAIYRDLDIRAGDVETGYRQFENEEDFIQNELNSDSALVGNDPEELDLIPIDEN